ncbi:MAG: cysteine hydrolase family protein [Opitutus sp.]
MKRLYHLAALAALYSTSAAAPKTLLEMTHAVPAMPPLTECAVLIIDAQREYVDGRLPLAGVTAALHQTARLLERARAAHVPIIHIQQISSAGRGVFERGGPLVAFAPEAAPLPGEVIIPKTLPNAFAGTTLAEVLRKRGRTHVIISGYMTHMCVSATARAALDFGFKNTVIADACATRDLRAADGGTLSADIVHRVALAELMDRFSNVVPSLDSIP